MKFFIITYQRTTDYRLSNESLRVLHSKKYIEIKMYAQIMKNDRQSLFVKTWKYMTQKIEFVIYWIKFNRLASSSTCLNPSVNENRSCLNLQLPGANNAPWVHSFSLSIARDRHWLYDNENL